GRELRLSGGVLEHLPRDDTKVERGAGRGQLDQFGRVPKRKTSLWPEALSNCAASSLNGPAMPPPAKIWSSAACTLAIDSSTRTRPSIKAAVVSEAFFIAPPLMISNAGAHLRRTERPKGARPGVR